METRHGRPFLCEICLLKYSFLVFVKVRFFGLLVLDCSVCHESETLKVVITIIIFIVSHQNAAPNDLLCDWTVSGKMR